MCFFKRVTLSILLLLSFLISAQNSDTSIEGYVKGFNSGFIKSAHVSLEGTNFKTVTDSKGFYKFTKLPSANYILLVSYVGKKTIKRKVDVINGAITSINIILEDSYEDLKEVIVNGKKVSSVAKKESFNVASSNTNESSWNT